MRHARPFALIALSALLGMVAVAFAANWLKTQEVSDTIKVVVAARDLQMGTRLQPEMLTVIQWPVAAPIQDPLTKLEQAVDRVINMPVLKGEPLLRTKLAAAGEKGGLSSVLSEGKRAVTVKVNEIVGVAGFALPGNYVDVMVNTPDSQDNPVSKIVIERIQVLAVAQDVASNENKPRVVNAVTLEVTPQQAEKIDLARSVGSLSLVLRSQVDTHQVSTDGARKSDLLQLPAPVARVAPVSRPLVVARSTVTTPVPAPALAPAPEKTEVIRGLSKSAE